MSRAGRPVYPAAREIGAADGDDIQFAVRVLVVAFGISAASPAIIGGDVCARGGPVFGGPLPVFSPCAPPERSAQAVWAFSGANLAGDPVVWFLVLVAAWAAAGLVRERGGRP